MEYNSKILISLTTVVGCFKCKVKVEEKETFLKAVLLWKIT